MYLVKENIDLTELTDYGYIENKNNYVKTIDLFGCYVDIEVDKKTRKISQKHIDNTNIFYSKLVEFKYILDIATAGLIYSSFTR